MNAPHGPAVVPAVDRELLLREADLHGNPMSHAQPSPPTIQILRLTR